MKCVRCGYCCISSAVIIIDPEFKDSFEKIDDFIDEHFTFKESGVVCPHLIMDDIITTCSIHDKKYYKDTPCYSHSQIESNVDDKCRMGKYITENDIKVMKFSNLYLYESKENEEDDAM